MGQLQINEMKERIHAELIDFKKISPILIMKKFKLSHDIAEKICLMIWLDQHLEARKMALGIEV